MSHSYSSRVCLVLFWAVPLGLLMLARQALADDPPPNPVLSKEERAAVEAAACAPFGCTQTCGAGHPELEPYSDSRSVIIGLLTGYFDGGTTLEAFASIHPCGGGDPAKGVSHTILLVHEGTQWLAYEEPYDNPTYVEKSACEVVRDGDRDLIICRSNIYGGRDSGTRITSLSRSHGTRVASPIHVWHGLSFYGCEDNHAEEARMTGFQILRNPGAETIVEVRIMAQKMTVSAREAARLGAERACELAIDRLCDINESHASKHVKGYHESTRAFSIPIRGHQLRLTPKIRRSVRFLDSSLVGLGPS
jgi:hypothetical protein